MSGRGADRPGAPGGGADGREAAEYVLPLRWTGDEGLEELTAYLRELAGWLDVTVVDGSEPERFAVHAAAWAGVVRHLAVDASAGGNGKVHGVDAGVRAARHEAVLVADDDVRYDRAGVRAVVAALREAELVKPQNVFDPAPWHARWDTGRSLLNRALGEDYPGTYGVRRSAYVAMGGYDPHVLFENLELERTVRASGGRVAHRPDVAVVRRPPTARHFRSQRVRQAYDSWAQPARLAAEAAILPAVVWAARRPVRLLALLAATVLVAERGRRRWGGAAVFPRTAALWAPLWLLERGVTAWAAAGLRARGGVRYGGTRLSRAAHRERDLRRARGADGG